MTPPSEILADFLQWLLQRCVLSPAACSAAAVADLIQLAFCPAAAPSEVPDSSAASERGAGTLLAAAATLWSIAAVSSTRILLSGRSAVLSRS